MNRDQKWINGIRNRNSKLILEIYNDILPGIKKWVKENGGNEDDARDLFQEMIIAVYKKTKNEDFILSCSFWSFALIICRNLWYAKNRQKDRIKYVDTISDESVQIEGEIIEHIENQERIKIFQKHFTTLDEKCRKILSLFFAKKKMKEIALELDTSENYIKKRKFKCKEKLILSIQADPLFKELSQ